MRISLLLLAELTLSLLISPLLRPLGAQPYNLFRESRNVNRLGPKLMEPYFEKKGILLYIEEDIELEPMLIVERTVADTTRYGALELEVFTVGGYLDRLIEEKTREMWRETLRKSFGREAKEAEDEGLLPDLELPMDLPKPLAKVIGRGGGLKVSGSNRVSLGGTTTFYDPEPPQEITRISRFPKLDLEQILRVKVEGTIGEKIHVFIDHDSEREFQEKNKIRVMYQGTEDEILQKVELGDTDVSLPGSRFVSGGMASKGLFGAKAEGALGDLHFTMVATKQKGQTEKKSFQGYATQDSLLLRDTQFQKNYHFSLVGRLDEFSGNAEDYPAPGTVQIWIDDQDGSNNLSGERIAIPGSAFIDPANPQDTTEAHRNGFFTLQQETVDYTIDPSNLIVDFTRAILDNYVVAVSYVTNGGDTVGRVTPDSVRLKLIKTPEYFASSLTWDYQLRNQYYLGSTDIIESTLQVFIYKGNDEDPDYDEEIDGVSKTYLHIFGLDDNEDGLVDPSKIDFNRGVIIFPDLRPFAFPSPLPHYIPSPDTIDIEDPNEAMYVDDNPQGTGLTNQIYTIKVKYRSLTSSFNLGVLNIIEGSDRVTVGGRPLSRGVDYDIIYDIGQIIFLNPDVLASGGEINVDYEYAPLFAQTQTTLLGFRGDYTPSENASLATTWFMQSDRSIEQKPRIGDESRRSVIGEVDGQLTLEPSFLTDMADALPLVQTEEVSKVDLSGEVAVSIPNPNTAGEVFLDDFEGSELVDSYSVVRALWVYGSIPPDTGGARSVDQGGNIRWFNAPREWGITEGKISPTVPAEEQGLLRTVLVVDFEPDTRDGTPPESSFRSITQPLSSSGLDMSQRKFLRIWLLSDHGELWVDLGSVNEDALRYRADGSVASPNSELDSEDDPDIPDGRLDAGEDTGLDGVLGADGAGVPDDDGNDDFHFNESDALATRFDRVNGTEDNDQFDTEDLNGNFSLDTSEKFFRVRLDLADQDRFVVSRNPETGWRLLEIPLADSTVFEEFLDPDIRRIKHARLTFTDFSRQDTVMIASLEIAGNRWLESSLESTDPVANPIGPEEEVTVSVRNTRDNVDYESPPGVTAVRYENIPSALQRVKEQSLALICENLAPGHSGFVNQPLLSPQNYISYGEFSVWVNGPEGSSTFEFFFRVGTDTTNFYEFKRSLAVGWQEFRVPFKTLTDAKQEILAILGEDTPADSIDMVHANGIRVRGKPSLTNVRMLMLGVGTPEGATAAQSGEIWIDELRLTNVNRNRGYAKRITVDTKIANLANVKVDYENRDNQFMQLNQRITEFAFKSRTATNVAATVFLDSFTPTSQGLSVPVTYSRTKSLELPKYETGSDILLDPGEEQERERTESVSESYGVRFSKKRPSQNMFVRATVDKVSYDATFSTRNSVNPTSRYWERTLNTGFGYSTPLEGDYDLPIFPKKVFGFLSRLPLPDAFKETPLVRGLSTARFRYAPTQFSLGGRFNNLSNERVTGTAVTPYRLNTTTGSGDVSLRPLRSLTSKYHLEVVTDRTQPKQGSFLGLFSFNKGTEIQRMQSIDINYSPEVISWFSPSWGYNTTYRENHRPEVARSLGDTTDVRKFDNTTRRNFSIDLNLPGIAAPLLTQKSAAAKDTTEAGRGLFSRSMGVIVGTLKPVVFSLSREKFSDYQFVRSRPSFSYQIGIEDLDIDPWERRISRTLGVDTGFKFPQGISLDGGYSEANTDRTSRSSSSFSSQKTWPKLNVSVSGIRVPKEWGGVLTSVTARSGYVVRKDMAGTETNGIESTTRSATFSPLISLTMNLLGGLSTQVSLEKGRAETQAFVGLRSTNVNTNSSQKLSLDYVFRSAKGFGIPLPGLSSKKIKFKSNMRTSLSFNRSRTRRVNTPEGGDEVVQSDNVTTSIQPSLSYDMARMTAGFRFNYDVNDDKKQEKKRITIGASMWIEFIF